MWPSDIADLLLAAAPFKIHFRLWTALRYGHLAAAAANLERWMHLDQEILES